MGRSHPVSGGPPAPAPTAPWVATGATPRPVLPRITADQVQASHTYDTQPRKYCHCVKTSKFGRTCESCETTFFVEIKEKTSATKNPENRTLNYILLLVLAKFYCRHITVLKPIGWCENCVAFLLSKFVLPDYLIATIHFKFKHCLIWNLLLALGLSCQVFQDSDSEVYWSVSTL